MRDANPTVVLIPGIGMFSFGKNKTEARVTGEFYTNAIHVMEGASALGYFRETCGFAASRASGEYGSVQRPLKLCGASAVGSVSHRVLEAGRSENPAATAGKGTEPAGVPDCGRRKRNWARDCAARCPARRACSCCGS